MIKDCNEHGCWRLFGTYGPTNYSDKKKFWEDMTERVNFGNLLWLMFRDLNEIVDDSESLGGRALKGKQLFLKEFIQQTGALDLGFVGRRFTWLNKQTGSTSIRRHLDKALSDSEWLRMYPKTTI